jgi:ABC-type branched-subunit amino acid transport system ATPase component
VAVVGSVGSGKSSLLAALLGDIKKTRGKVIMRGDMALVTQQAWIQNATLKDNILYGSEYDHERYKPNKQTNKHSPPIPILSWDAFHTFQPFMRMLTGDSVELGQVRSGGWRV